ISEDGKHFAFAGDNRYVFLFDIPAGTKSAVFDAGGRSFDRSRMKGKGTTAWLRNDSTSALLTELVAHLRQNRTQLREEWARRITESQLLTAMTKEEIFVEATSVYDNYVAVLETGAVEALQEYARESSELICTCGDETHEVLGI